MIVRLDVAYDGSGFHGWAAQPGLRTVEGVLVAALDRVYPGHGRLHVAGRTDTGVHALGQVASVEVGRGPAPADAWRALTGLLPPDVAVVASSAAPDAFHARHSARARAYLYRVRVAPTRAPLDARRALHHPRPLDAAVLDACAAALLGTHDFTAFTPTETQHDTFVRTVRHAAWHDRGEERWLAIAADAFLRHQVRTLVGTMLEAARGERDPASFPALLAGAPRSAAGATAPPWGLYLAGVRFEGEADGAELARIAGMVGGGAVCVNHEGSDPF